MREARAVLAIKKKMSTLSDSRAKYLARFVPMRRVHPHAVISQSRAVRGVFCDGMMSPPYPATAPVARGFATCTKAIRFVSAATSRSRASTTRNSTVSWTRSSPVPSGSRSSRPCAPCAGGTRRRHRSSSSQRSRHRAHPARPIRRRPGDTRDAFGVEFVVFVLIGVGLIVYRKRVVRSARLATDQELIALLAEWTHKMGGRATFQLHVKNDGVFRSKHQTIQRVLYVVPAGAAAPVVPEHFVGQRRRRDERRPGLLAVVLRAQSPSDVTFEDTYVNVYPAPAPAFLAAYSYPTAPDEQTRGPSAREVFVAVRAKGAAESAKRSPSRPRRVDT